MSSIPPANANLVTGIVTSSVSQRQRSVEKAADETQQASQTQEQSLLSDQQQHQVEDTLHTHDTRVCRQDDEEFHRQRRHRHRKMPEDQPAADSETDASESEHIDLQA